MMTVLVTGATGLVGRACVPAFTRAGLRVRAAARHNGPRLEDPTARWGSLVSGCDVVVHLAARVHQMDAGEDPRFMAANSAGTLRLATQARDAGVRRFVFVSTVKVHGEQGHVTAHSPFHPADAYARSKRDAEIALEALARQTGLELVIVRPPLVYGPGVEANFGRLVRMVRRGWPIPLGAVRNQRSLIGTTNLADALLAAATSPGAPGAAVAVADPEPVSTPDLIRAIAEAAGVRARLWSVPLGALRLLARLAGRSTAMDRLCSSLTVDLEPARHALAWVPRHPLTHDLTHAVMGGAPRTVSR